VAVRPREQRGLVDVPVSLPDDEIMVDRLRLTKEAQAAAWLNVLGETHARGEVFTLQLHPERIFESLEALRAVLAAARQRQPRVWIARLDEIADWWLRRREARLQVAEVRPERYRVSLSGDADATLLVRNLPAPATTPWFGHDLVAEARDFEVDSPLSPVLGMSTRVPQVVRDFLEEEGFPIQISEDRTRFGVYLGPEDAKLDEVTLLSRIDLARRPLVRLWRWPRAARSALAVTGDIDSITLQDFALRLVETWETPRLARAASPNGASVYPPVSGEVGGLR
jgi:hypothetical protein